jgi:hypothetical protein
MSYTPNSTFVRADQTSVPDTNNTYDIGSASFKYANVYATTFNGESTSAQYADLAENFVGDMQYEPGTVVGIGGTKEVTADIDLGSSKVIGVVSTNPAFLMNSDCKGEFVVAVAYKGRVPCKVSGIIERGDLLTAGGNGIAIRADSGEPGTIIGRALEDFFDMDSIGIIEILVGI